MRTLIICEKNDAAKQIAKALSGGTAKQRRGAGVPVYEFEWKGGPAATVGLRGHIVELDFVKGHSRWSIQPEKLHALVDAGIQKEVTEPEIVAAIQERAKEADLVIVGTDYDREGELIGVEALDALGKTLEGKTVRRAKYSSFTAKEVQQAFDNLQDIDRRMAAAGEARQLIDLAWGAALTRYLSVAGGRRGRGFLSVGRVQTPTLGLVVQRELERMAFVANDYWEVEADLEAARERFTAEHESSGYGERDGGFSLEGRFKSQAEADRAAAAVRSAGKATVLDVKARERTIHAPAPFSTTLFQTECSSHMGMGVKRAMDIAQHLYLGGYISYHRTENTVYPPTLDLNEIVQVLQKGPTADDAAWVAGNRRAEPTRGKKETKDHPPIYPTAVPGPEAKLSDVEWKVWELVARRFLATLSPDARVQAVTARFGSGGETLRATGQTTLEAGWRRVYPYSGGKESPLPPLKEGDVTTVVDVRMSAKQTQPPKRFGQGGLIAKMEELGIGTKATRHEMIQKLIDRNYITDEPVAPTEVGFAITRALEEHARPITEAAMTARLEEEMQQIEAGERTLDETVADSRTMLHQIIDVLLENKDPIAATVRTALDKDADAGTCPTCSKQLLVRENRFGGRFIGCKGYPECTVTYNLPARGKLQFRPEPCADCHAPFVAVEERGRRQEFCVNPECPTRVAQAEEEKMDLGACPTCGTGTLEVVRSRAFKRFVRCNNPECKDPSGRGTQTYPLPQRGAIEYDGRRCEACKAPRVLVVTKGRKPWDICVNMGCPSNERKDKGEAPAKGKRPGRGGGGRKAAGAKAA